MTIQDEKVVSLTYTLLVDGEVKDQATEENPLEFIYGLGYLLPKFEENIAGKTVGDKFDFRLSAAEGYGERDERAVIDLPKTIFMRDGHLAEEILFEGNVIPMMNADGGVMPGTVVKIGDNHVTMDFNHQMAGTDLHFTGEILLVRDATEEELTNGLHGERKGCGGKCGSCNSDCEKGCDCE